MHITSNMTKVVEHMWHENLLTNAKYSHLDFFYSVPKNAKHTQHSKHGKHGCINLNDRFFLSDSHFTFYFSISTSISKAIFMFLCKRCKKHVFQVFCIHTSSEITYERQMCLFVDMRIYIYIFRQPELCSLNFLLIHSSSFYSIVSLLASLDFSSCVFLFTTIISSVRLCVRWWLYFTINFSTSFILEVHKKVYALLSFLWRSFFSSLL